MKDSFYPSREALFHFQEPRSTDKFFRIAGPLPMKIDYDDVAHDRVLADARCLVNLLNGHWPLAPGTEWQTFMVAKTDTDCVTRRVQRAYPDRGLAWARDIAEMAASAWCESQSAAACCAVDQYLAAKITAKYRFALVVSLEIARTALTRAQDTDAPESKPALASVMA